MKRLPSLEEISDSEKKLDLLAGFRTKDSFVELKKNESSSSSCAPDL